MDLYLVILRHTRILSNIRKGDLNIKKSSRKIDFKMANKHGIVYFQFILKY